MMCQDEVYSADNLIELTPNLPAIPKNDLDDNNSKGAVLGQDLRIIYIPQVVVVVVEEDSRPLPQLLSNILLLQFHLPLEPLHIHQRLLRTPHSHPHSSTTSHPRLLSHPTVMLRGNLS